MVSVCKKKMIKIDFTAALKHAVSSGPLTSKMGTLANKVLSTSGQTIKRTLTPPPRGVQVNMPQTHVPAMSHDGTSSAASGPPGSSGHRPTRPREGSGSAGTR